jgi:hypothetical protein
MADETPMQILLQDPLQEVTRKERRSLLGASLIGIAVSKGGFLPKKISAFGLGFSEINRRFLLILVLCVVVYYLAIFIVYAFPNFLAWRDRFRSSVDEVYGGGTGTKLAVPYPRRIFSFWKHSQHVSGAGSISF